MALNDRQKRFCELYVGKCEFHGTNSAIEAGYSKKTAYSIANENLKKPEIKSYIAELLEHKRGEDEVVINRIKNELCNIAFANIGDYLKFSDDGVEFTDSKKLTREQSAVISEVQETKAKDGGRTVKFKMYCKDNALVQLGRMYGLFNDETQKEDTTVPITVNITRDNP